MKMLRQQNVPGRSLYERQNQSVPNVPSPHFTDWRKDPQISGFRGLVRSRIAEIFKRRTEHTRELEQRASNFANALENQLFAEAACKEEYVNKKILMRRLQNLVQRGVRKTNPSQANRLSSLPNLAMIPTVRDCSSKDSGTNSSERASSTTTYSGGEEFTGSGAIENGPGFSQSTGELSLTSTRGCVENVPSSVSMVYPSALGQVAELSTSCLRDSKISNIFPCMIPDTHSSTLEDALQPYLQLGRLKAQSQRCLVEQYGSCIQEEMENESNLPLLSKERLNISPAMVSEPWKSSLEDVLQSQSSMLKHQGNQQLPRQAHLQFDNAFKLHQLFSEKLNGGTDGTSENCAFLSGCKKHSGVEDLNEGPNSNNNADILRPLKRQKMENLPGNGVPQELAAQIVQACVPEGLPRLEQWPESPLSMSSEVKDVNIEVVTNSIQEGSDLALSIIKSISEKVPISPDDNIYAHMPERRDSTKINDISESVLDYSSRLQSGSVPTASENLDVGHKGKVLVQTNIEEAKIGFKSDLSIPKSEHKERWKLDNQNVNGASLIESFTAEQIKKHVSSLRQWIQYGRENRTITTVSENTCQLCLADRLSFAPTPIYCSVCCSSIKRSVTYYYTPNENGMHHFFCSKCYREGRGGSISVNGNTISKKNMCKRKNDEEIDEPWVQCDTCEGWQHQICALYNDKTDLEGKAKYICPQCCLEEIETQQRTPLPETAVFSAKDLPSTVLSDHLEQRLFWRLKEDREERAKVAEKDLDEVPEAKDLVVRVVLSVDKHVIVKKQFLDIFQDQSYPEKFQYRSKVILLFQKIDGVDVCLFSMYVQEYGSECSDPNRNCLYISYLDSVKYFRPNTQTASGEALRTFVYHEIMIGYLEYCKKRGYVTCYIWACPPIKGEDYILYCHPQVQKTPKSDKLRQWYHSLLRKAEKEDIVVDFTNLYDHFFVPTGEWKTKITAARIPYFDGDYCSCSIERWIRDIEKECGGDKQQVKKLMTNRTLKAMGLTNPSASATKDILIMQKLANSILPWKEDFIVVHLQFVCTQCHEVILSGLPWFCKQCTKCQLCERCHDSRKSDTHSLNDKEKHLLHQVNPKVSLNIKG